MMPAEQAQFRRSQKLLEKLRTVVKHFGSEPLELRDMRQLRSRYHLQVVISGEIRAASLLLSESAPGATQRLAVRRGVTIAQKRYLELWHTAFVAAGYDPGFAAAAADVAYFGVLDTTTCGARGPLWLQRVRDELGALEHERAELEDVRAREHRVQKLRMADCVAGGSIVGAVGEIDTTAEQIRQRAIEMRGAGEYPEAEWAFRQAARIAVGAFDWVTAVRAQLGLGKVRMERGHLDAAKRCFERALADAEAHGAAAEVPRALHDLFLNAVESGHHQRADRLARRALDAYQRAHSDEIHRFAHDLARHHLLLGHSDLALPVLLEVEPLFTDRGDRAQVWGNIARAAGGLGDPDRFEDACSQVERFASTEECPHVAAALVGVAIGAKALGYTDRARSYAFRCMRIAITRGEGKIAREAAEITRASQARGAGHAGRAQLAQDAVAAIRAEAAIAA